MKKTCLLTLLCVFLINLIALEKVYDFKNADDLQSAKLINAKGRFKPRAMDGAIELLNGGYAKNHNNAVIFPDSIPSSFETEEYKFQIFISKGAEGAGFALLNQKHISQDSSSFIAHSWEQPNFEEAFGLGIDVYNPQTSAWFDEYGNIYGREQREISLHWNNKEIYKILSPIEFRSDPITEQTADFLLAIRYINAGALINVSINDTLIIQNFFIPEMTQYDKQPIFGASSSDLSTSFYLTAFSYQNKGNAPIFKKTDTIQILKDEIFFAGRRNMTKTSNFKKINRNADKAILTLDLSGAPGGLSAWDVGAAIYIVDKDSVHYEICRYITPYNRAFVWKVDVSDFLPLFNGIKSIYAKVDTWETTTEDPAQQKGWKVNATIDFYKGNEPVKASKVNTLWKGYFEYGNPDKPLKEHLKDLKVNLSPKTKKAKIRVCLTGHGMSPNSENAGEFKPTEITLKINGKSFTHKVWKTDCYLNACRPQDGTWKFDRTGWAPGSIAQTWELDISHIITETKNLDLSYIPDDYINQNIGDHYPPHHWIECTLIEYE